MPSEAPSLVRALASLRTLLANPDDLPQVFSVLEELSGNTTPRVAKRMATTEGGRWLLTERPAIVPRLANRETLLRLPQGSLGRTYATFMESHGLSPEGIREAEARGRRRPVDSTAEADYVDQRLRDTHDLWHAVTGYGGDVLGELALLAFTFAQTWNPGVLLLVSAGLARSLGAPEAWELIVEGFRRGLRAQWLPEQAWEGLLERPVAEVRRQLNLGSPPTYTPVATAEILARLAA